jgi:hypothetical protein
MEVTEKIAIVKTAVANYFDKNCEYAFSDPIWAMHNKQHIVQIGTSIICTQRGVGPMGGGFVQAVVNDRLAESFARADSTNQRALRFYCMLMQNLVL